MTRTEGQRLLESVGEICTSLERACQDWPKQLLKNGKEIPVSHFIHWLCESSKITAAPKVANYNIGNAVVFSNSFRNVIQETRKETLEAIEQVLLPKALSTLKKKLWNSCIKGCPSRCPSCGVKCEKEHLHQGNHFVSEKMHLFPSFNKWVLQKEDGTKFVDLDMCLDPFAQKRKVKAGDKKYPNFHDYLKDQKTNWLPFEGNSDFSKPSDNIKKAWVNCRQAIIYMRTLGDINVIDDTPNDWIEAYEEKENEITVEMLNAMQASDELKSTF